MLHSEQCRKTHTEATSCGIHGSGQFAQFAMILWRMRRICRLVRAGAEKRMQFQLLGVHTEFQILLQRMYLSISSMYLSISRLDELGMEFVDFLLLIGQ